MTEDVAFYNTYHFQMLLCIRISIRKLKSLVWVLMKDSKEWWNHFWDQPEMGEWPWEEKKKKDLMLYSWDLLNWKTNSGEM